MKCWHTRGGAMFVKVLNVFTCRQTDVITTTKCPFFFFSACNCSSSSPSTHLCPPEDIVHSCVPRLCPQCSSTPPGWGAWAEDARSPWTQTLTGSTEPGHLETLSLTEERFHLGMRITFWHEKWHIIQVDNQRKQRWQKKKKKGKKKKDR